MKKKWPYKFEILLLLSSFIIVGYFIFVIMLYPMIGIKVQYNSSNCYVVEVEKYGWAYSNGIKKGDIITKIDGKTPIKNAAVKFFSKVGKVKEIELNKNGSIKKYNVKYDTKDNQVIYHILLPIVSFFICFVFNIFIIVHNCDYESHSVKILIRFFNLLGMVYISSVASGRLDILGNILVSITFIYIFILILAFIKEYFKEKKLYFIKEGVFIWLRIITFTLLTLSIILRFRYYDFTVNLDIITFILLFIITSIVLTRSYLSNRHNTNLGILKIIIFSILIPWIPFILFFVIPNTLLGEEFFTFEITICFLMLIPVFFVYLLISRSLFDLKFIIHRIPYYASISLGILGCLFILELIFFKQFNNSILEIIQFYILIFILNIIFLYIKDYLDFKLRKVLYYYKKNYQRSLNRFLFKSRDEYKFSSLINYIKKELEDVLTLKEVLCLEINKSDNKLDNKLDFHKFIYKNDFNSFCKLPWDTNDVGSIIWLEEYFTIVVGNLTDKKIVLLCKPVNSKKKMNIDEITWLETIANYTDLLFESSRKTESVLRQLMFLKDTEKCSTGFTRLSFMISEKERDNFARDIHDGVLQDQLRLYRKIEEYEKQFTEPQIILVLREIREELADQICGIRDTCNNLRPAFLHELGLEKSLLNLFKKINLEANFSLYYDIEGELEKTNIELENNIYRIVQEMLNNAIKHSQASVVKLKLYKENKNLCLTYSDNGVGMNTDIIKNSFSTMGISGMIARVRGLNGILVIKSEAKEGMKIKIELKM